MSDWKPSLEQKRITTHLVHNSLMFDFIHWKPSLEQKRITTGSPFCTMPMGFQLET